MSSSRNALAIATCAFFIFLLLFLLRGVRMQPEQIGQEFALRFGGTLFRAIDRVANERHHSTKWAGAW